MRALVTGAAGFLGTYLVRELLDQNYDVRALVRRPVATLQELGVQEFLGDIRDASSMETAFVDIDIVFHTAAISGIWGPWSTYYETNTLGTENILAGCLKHGVNRLVYTSSPSVTFTGSPQVNVDESAPYADRWYCHYPHSKALAEQQVLAANNPPKLMTCALRPHLIWGPGDRHLIPRLIQRARSGQLRQVGPGTNLIDTTYAENAALAHVQAAERMAVDSPVCGNAYFISQGEPVNCWSFINEVLALVDEPPVSKAISFPVAYWLGHGLELAYRLGGRTDEPRMTRFLAAQLAQPHYFNISRARRDFDYRPRISHEEGMRRLKAALNGSA